MSHALDKAGRWIGWAFLRRSGEWFGFDLRLHVLQTRPMQYPDKEKWLPYSRYRGHHFLKRDAEGEIKCVACRAVRAICPCDCIEVVPYEDEKGNRRPAKFADRHGPAVSSVGSARTPARRTRSALANQYEFSSSHRATW